MESFKALKCIKATMAQVQVQVQVQGNLFCQYKYNTKTSMVDINGVTTRLLLSLHAAANTGATHRYIIIKII